MRAISAVRLLHAQSGHRHGRGAYLPQAEASSSSRLLAANPASYIPPIPIPPTWADSLRTRTPEAPIRSRLRLDIRVAGREFRTGPLLLFLIAFGNQAGFRSTVSGPERRSARSIRSDSRNPELWKNPVRSSPFSCSVAPKITISESGSASRNFARRRLYSSCEIAGLGSKQDNSREQAQCGQNTHDCSISTAGSTQALSTLRFRARLRAARPLQRNVSRPGRMRRR